MRRAGENTPGGLRSSWLARGARGVQPGLGSAPDVRGLRRLAAAGWVAALMVAGCSADKPPPTPLAAFTAAANVGLVWRARLEGGVDFPMQPALRGDQLVVAGSDGTVLALQASTGATVWRGSAGAPLAAGVGSDGRYAAVVTRDQELVVLDGGARLWSAKLASRTVTPPLVAGERVFVMGVDRIVQAFDARDGLPLWKYSRPGAEALTLAQPGLLAVHRDTLLAGQGAVMVGLDPLRGSTRWEVALSSPRGTNEVERLNDLLGPASRIAPQAGAAADVFCARVFQTAVGCVDAQRRALRWSRSAPGLQAVAADVEMVAGGDGADRVSAWRAASGDLLWTNEALRYRGLSIPAVTPKGVWFGDAEGQMHLLGRADGRTIARLPTDGSAVVGPLLQTQGLVLAVTRAGGVHALRAD